MIRILLAEDQTMVLGALAALLELEGDLEVVGRAADGETALRLARELEPDVVLTDIEMPGMSGLELATELRGEASPQVVILTTFARPGYLRRALEAGVRGYLLKDSPSEELARAVREVHRGGRALSPELAAEAWSEPDPLTDRERQVLRLALEGHSGGAMAERLHLSEGTVRNYLSEAIGKTGAVNRTEAARIARRKGWL
ncbi:MAG: response regulator transcription factor [Holophagales bacterium]|nr:response regulator transcription factor [Holophagales bacterium]